MAISKNIPKTQAPEKQADGSLIWPADPDFTPDEISEQDLVPVEDATLDDDYAEPDPGTSEEDEKPPSKKTSVKEED